MKIPTVNINLHTSTCTSILFSSIIYIICVGSTGHDLPKELHGEDCHNSDNTSSDKVQAQHVVAKKKKRFKGFRIRV